NLSNIVVSNSSAAQGGGLYVASLANPDAPIAIERSTFNDNTAASDGGGIYAQCSLSLAGSSFANNTAQDNGGAITMTAIEDNAIARLAMSDTLVAGNSALGGSGGGIFASADTTELRLTEGSENPQRMKIFGNSAAKDGGGLFIAGEDAMFYIHGALIESNTAGDNGGGVSVRTARSSVELMDQGANGEDVDYSVRPTVTGNSAGLNGGGMYFGKPLVASEFSGYVSMYAQDAVISHNKAGVNGGGIGLECDNNYTHFYQGPENGAMPIEISKNSAGNSGGGVYLKGEEGSTFYASGIILSDNAALGQQGSATGDGGGVYCWGQMHTMVSLNSWRTDSPSLVTGNTAAGSGGGVYAFSTQASTYVDAQSTDIVDNSAAGDGGGVYIKGNYYGSIRLSGGYDYETGDQTFRSLARNTAGGSGGGVYAEGNFSNVMAERIEIDANRAAVDGGGICYVPQGAIDLWSGDPIHWNTNPLFMGVMFTENQAGGSGGGLYVGDNNDQDMGSISLMFEDSQFNENAAGNGSGGALYVGDNIEALYFQPSAEGNSSSFTNNNAAVDGGGAYIGDNLQNASINTVEFSGNKAQGNGGAVRIGHSSELLPETLLVEQSLFEKNSAAQHGGAVWIPYDSLDRLKVDSEEESDKTIFTGNTASRELESVLKKFPEDITRHDEKIFTTMFSEKPADYDYGVSGRASNPFSYAYNNFDISYKAAYMVFYDGNGNTAGEAPTDVVKYLPGETTVVQGSGSLVKDGYTFGGWALSAEGTEAVTSPLTLDDHDVTLYAIWTKDSVVDPGGPAVPIDSGSAGKPIDVGSKLIQTGDFDMVPIAIIAGIVVLAATAAVVARRFAKAQGVNEENTK
ncbi:MAG: InlB B-repeat-containing protein, partial [Raoultibacter sp.]